MISNSQAYLVTCGVLCIYPLAVSFIVVQLYRAYIGGAFHRRSK